MKFVLIKRRSAILAAAAVLILVGAIVAVSCTNAARVFSNQTTRLSPINAVATDAQVVALSFDASWGEGHALDILRVLEEQDARATYFVIGSWAEKHSEYLRALSSSGRVEIGTHSNTHSRMPRLRERQMEFELNSSVSIIQGITGNPIDLFRPPFGEYSDTVLSVAERLGFFTIRYDVDSLDWQDLSSYDLTTRVLTQAGAGSIILLHNDGRNTLEALPAIIQGLRNRGLELVTVGEMIHRENFTIDQNGKQIKR